MSKDSFSLSGWALVLGASSGFGEAASLAFARAGLNVIGVHLGIVVDFGLGRRGCSATGICHYRGSLYGDWDRVTGTGSWFREDVI